jgi:ankyrin repeat protein
MGTALLLGDVERAREMVLANPTLIQDPAVLSAALTNGHDTFACELIEAGANLSNAAADYSLLSMAATWGNPKSVKALIAAGSDPNRRSGVFTPLSMCISRSQAAPDVVAEVVANLLAGGAEVRCTKIEGLSLLQWCSKKGFEAAAELLRKPPD